MAVDDDLAAVGKLDLEDAGTDHGKIEVGAARFETGLNPLERRLGKDIEFAIIHPVLPFCIFGNSPMRHEFKCTFTFAILLAMLTLAACGTRGPLTLPPPVTPAATQASAPAAAADLNTAKDPAR